MKRTKLNWDFLELGRSILGAPLLYLPCKSATCELLIIAGIHGEEPETTVALSRALRSITSFDSRICVLLCANPDGVSLGTRGNANGVDLNRNFPTKTWQPDDVNCRWFYDRDEVVSISTGKSAGSEVETQLLIELVNQTNPASILSLHGPIGCIDHPQPNSKSQWLAERTQLPLVNEIGYPTPGSMGTWAAERNVDIITWEFPCESVEGLSSSQSPVLIDILQGHSPFTSSS